MNRLALYQAALEEWRGWSSLPAATRELFEQVMAKKKPSGEIKRDNPVPVQAAIRDYLAARAGLIKSPGETSPKPSPLKEVDPDSQDATPKVYSDIAEYMARQRGKKFLVNGSPRSSFDGDDYPKAT